MIKNNDNANDKSVKLESEKTGPEKAPVSNQAAIAPETAPPAQTESKKS